MDVCVQRCGLSDPRTHGLVVKVWDFLPSRLVICILISLVFLDYYWPGMETHTFNPNIWDAETGLVYIIRPCVKNKTIIATSQRFGVFSPDWLQTHKIYLPLLLGH